MPPKRRQCGANLGAKGRLGGRQGCLHRGQMLRDGRAAFGGIGAVEQTLHPARLGTQRLGHGPRGFGVKRYGRQKTAQEQGAKRTQQKGHGVISGSSAESSARVKLGTPISRRSVV